MVAEIKQDQLIKQARLHPSPPAAFAALGIDPGVPVALTGASPGGFGTLATAPGARKRSRACSEAEGRQGRRR